MGQADRPRARSAARRYSLAAAMATTLRLMLGSIGRAACASAAFKVNATVASLSMTHAWQNQAAQGAARGLEDFLLPGKY